MSQTTGDLDKTFIASGDLSLKQYYIVKMTGSGTPYGVELAAATTDLLLGILQNKPKSGEAAVVRLSGTSKLVTNGAVTTSSPISVTSTGTGTPSSGAGNYIIGFALEDSAASGDIIEILIDRMKS